MNPEAQGCLSPQQPNREEYFKSGYLQVYYNIIFVCSLYKTGFQDIFINFFLSLSQFSLQIIYIDAFLVSFSFHGLLLVRKCHTVR